MAIGKFGYQVTKNKENGGIIMLSYKVLSRDVIEIDLKNGYKVVAMSNWNNEKKKYYTTLLLHEKTVDKWDLLEDFTNVDINMNSNVKTIRKDMAIYITTLFGDGRLKKYIDRYEYELKCFDIGNEVMEKYRGNNI